MYLTAVYAFALLLGGVSLYISFKIMRRFTWFLAWLRGTAGFFFLAFSFCVLYAAFDLSDYDELLEERAIASITFDEIANQHFQAKITYYIDKEDDKYQIYGDQWQIDARIVRWTGVIAALGAKPGFQLDRISGRYFALEDEHDKPRSVYDLYSKPALFDMWHVLNNNTRLFPGIDARYGSAAYLPMADAASFKLLLSHNGLTAEPINEIAKNAVLKWR